MCVLFLSADPVVLDPNTAHPYLILSQDLTSVRFKDKRLQVPDSPERFEKSASVLGSEGFISGTHFWDVDLGKSKLWVVGVMRESSQRNGDSSSFRSGVWGVALFHGKYRALAPSQPLTPIAAQKKLQWIRVQLDYHRGQLSFSDPDNDTHLHTFEQTFTERVFPYFLIDSPLRIVPVNAALSVELLSYSCNPC